MKTALLLAILCVLLVISFNTMHHNPQIPNTDIKDWQKVKGDGIFVWYYHDVEHEVGIWSSYQGLCVLPDSEYTLPSEGGQP
jgi:hypothetical protein